ncbi:hypothetical protein BG005_004220 [Podila minutissima]|nr:hypothetical protein BG005_004220 [Podila minutissima]
MTTMAAPSETSQEQLPKEREAFLSGTDWSSVFACAEAFYNKFQFKNVHAAKDSFRQALKAVATTHNWATLFLEEMKSKDYRDQERKLVKEAKKPEQQQHTPTPTLAGHRSRTFARATLTSNQNLLLASNRTTCSLALEEIASATQVEEREHSGMDIPGRVSAAGAAGAGQDTSNGLLALKEGDEDDDVGFLDAQMRTKDHPFFFLLCCLHDIYYGRPHSVPPEPSNLTNMQTLLFRYVVSQLHSFAKLKTIKKKDVYVAASMIAHLEMDDARKAFGTDMIEALSPLILDTEFSTTRPAIKTILNRIVEQVVDADKGADARKTHLLATMELGRLAEAQLLGEPLHQLSFQIHEIVRLMAKICEPRVASLPKPSESMAVRTWQGIFDILFHDTSVSVVTRETGLSATWKERETSKQEHGAVVPPVSPRKVDFVILTSIAHDHKLAHFQLLDYEHKKSSAGDEEWSVQVRKSLRHNQVLMTQLPDIDDLFFLNIQGYTAKPIRMHLHDGVHIAGTMSEDIKLPTTPQELETFLNGQALSALCCVREQVLWSAKAVQDHALTPKKPPLMSSLAPPPAPKRARAFYTSTSMKC